MMMENAKKLLRIVKYIAMTKHSAINVRVPIALFQIIALKTEFLAAKSNNLIFVMNVFNPLSFLKTTAQFQIAKHILILDV